MGLGDYRKGELRFRALANADPENAERLLEVAQQTVALRWDTYEEMAMRTGPQFPPNPQGPR
jgi:pyruvate-ferredoxin/flavodoxin oxidoreductase